MAIDFSTLLSDEQKRNLLSQRIEQFAGEAYQHELNRQIAEKISDTNSVAQSEAALATLETAITVHQEELNLLGE
jgi:hypothetical protein